MSASVRDCMLGQALVVICAQHYSHRGYEVSHEYHRSSHNVHEALVAAFLTVRFSIRFSNTSPWKILFTNTLGVCTMSGSSSPGSTRCSTSAIVILAAVAIIGLKFRAVLR